VAYALYAPRTVTHKIVFGSSGVRTKFGSTQPSVVDDLAVVSGFDIGHPGGAWLAPEGTPYEGRALPHDSLDKEIHKYVIHAEKGLPPGWKIEESLAAPWFGHPGGGPQYRIIAPLGMKARTQDLIDRGFLEDICGP